MPCISVPKVPVPQLPSPLSLTPPAISLPGFDAALCCNVHIPPPDLPYPLNLISSLPPLVLNLAVINTLLGYVDEINQFTSKLSIDCPTE